MSAEYVGILGQPDIGQPLGRHPAVVQLRDVRVFTEVRLAQLLHRQPQLLLVHRLLDAERTLQIGVSQLQHHLAATGGTIVTGGRHHTVGDTTRRQHRQPSDVREKEPVGGHRLETTDGASVSRQ